MELPDATPAVRPAGIDGGAGRRGGLRARRSVPELKQTFSRSCNALELKLEIEIES
jgi:hypothetical protein